MAHLSRNEPRLEDFPADDQAPAKPDNWWAFAMLKESLEVTA
jgi:hypothetical protein